MEECMSILSELLLYDPTNYAKKFAMFAAVGTGPRNLGLIADRANVTTGEAIAYIHALSDDGLVVCHCESAQEWRLASA
jgi:hypothetical protein